MADTDVRLGLRENWQQFSLLVLVNAFVGAMVGLERSILPAIAQEEFGIAARVAILSFIVAFGLTKAAANYVAGRLADRFGRRHILVAGWLIALPVPLLLMHAPTWNWIVAANVLLGVSQGLTWSVTVIMKIDLAGPRQRGLAMGLNEFAGYAALAGSALATAWIAAEHGLRPEPFYLGIAFVLLGLALSLFAVRETRHHVAHEAAMSEKPEHPSSQGEVFWRTTLTDRNLSSVTQAGLVNNVNDGMAWGLFPVWFAAAASAAEYAQRVVRRTEWPRGAGRAGWRRCVNGICMPLRSRRTVPGAASHGRFGADRRRRGTFQPRPWNEYRSNRRSR